MWLVAEFVCYSEIVLAPAVSSEMDKKAGLLLNSAREATEVATVIPLRWYSGTYTGCRGTALWRCHRNTSSVVSWKIESQWYTVLTILLTALSTDQGRCFASRADS
jgi:hypothetical protein